MQYSGKEDGFSKIILLLPKERPDISVANAIFKSCRSVLDCLTEENDESRDHRTEARVVPHKFDPRCYLEAAGFRRQNV